MHQQLYWEKNILQFPLIKFNHANESSYNVTFHCNIRLTASSNSLQVYNNKAHEKATQGKYSRYEHTQTYSQDRCNKPIMYSCPLLFICQGCLEPRYPHGCCFLILFVCLSSVLLFQHSLLHKNSDIGQAQTIYQRTTKTPPTIQAPTKDRQSPPPQLLTKIVWMPWIAP